MKNARSSEAAILILNLAKHSFSLRVLLKSDSGINLEVLKDFYLYLILFKGTLKQI